MRRPLAVTAVALALVIAAAPSAHAAPCGASGQSVFSVKVPAGVAVGRRAFVAVAGPDGDVDRSGDWSRTPPASITLDDPSAATLDMTSEGDDPSVNPLRIGWVGLTVSWTQSNSQTGEECSRSEHVAFEAVRGKAPAATIMAYKSGDYELNEIAAGLQLKGGCTPDNSQFAAMPVTWTLHWSTNGHAPTRGSHTLRWGSPDPCLLFSDGQKLTGPKRVSNKTCTATLQGVGYETVRVIPAFRSHGMRGWWEVTVDGKLVKSTRFKFVAGSGYRTFEGHRFPITGVRLEPDKGPCPGLRCTPWGKLPSLSPTAAAAREVPSDVRDGPALDSTHFSVHYGSQPAALAQHVADVLEAALTTETGWGWPAPVDDGDGRVDVYVYDAPGVEGAAHFESGRRPVAGWIQVGATASELVMSHELLHVLQYAVPGAQPAFFLTEGTAHWAGNRFEAERGGTETFPPLWANSNYLGVPLECPATSSCDNNTPAIGQWAWFEYLAERFDPTIVADMFRRGAQEDGTPAGDLRATVAALAARGANLGSVFTDYATATASARWKLAPLAKIFYPRPSATMTASRVGQKLAPVSLTLDHLSQAAVYGLPTCRQCSLALKLHVSWPSGIVGVRPAWVRHDLKLVKQLTVSGSSASGTLPLDGTTTPAMLILANPSASLDGQRFAVTAVVVAGPPPVVSNVSGKRSGPSSLRLTFTASAGGRFTVRIGGQKITIIANAGTNSGDLFIGRLRGRKKLTVTPIDTKGRRGKPVSTTVAL